LNRLFGGGMPRFEFIQKISLQPASLFIVVILYFIQAGLEELGWRGFMLERMQNTMKPLGVSLVVGISHAMWHLPLLWVGGTNQIRWGFGVDFWIFIAVVVAGSVYSTWCYNNNSRSTLAVIVLQFTTKMSLDIFTEPGAQQRIYNMLVIIGAVVIAAVWLFQNHNSMDIMHHSHHRYE
jgi:membrane protease YdiL (CAAX protease family)